MSLGHCGNACAPKGQTYVIDHPIHGKIAVGDCRSRGYWCAWIASCKPWWMPKWLGWKIYLTRTWDCKKTGKTWE